MAQRRSKTSTGVIASAGCDHIARLAGLDIEGEGRRAAAALQRPLAVPFMREEVSQRGQQKGAKPTLLRIDIGQEVLLQKLGEEALGQVPRLFGAVALMADVGVERLPVGLAERLQGRPSLGVGTVSGGQHLAPLRRSHLALMLLDPQESQNRM